MFVYDAVSRNDTKVPAVAVNSRIFSFATWEYFQKRIFSWKVSENSPDMFCLFVSLQAADNLFKNTNAALISV